MDIPKGEGGLYVSGSLLTSGWNMISLATLLDTPALPVVNTTVKLGWAGGRDKLLRFKPTSGWRSGI